MSEPRYDMDEEGQHFFVPHLLSLAGHEEGSPPFPGGWAHAHDARREWWSAVHALEGLMTQTHWWLRRLYDGPPTSVPEFRGMGGDNIAPYAREAEMAILKLSYKVEEAMKGGVG